MRGKAPTRFASPEALRPRDRLARSGEGDLLGSPEPGRSQPSRASRGRSGTDNMKRIERLRHVLAVCYCRLQPSPIHGIGVYAVRVIPRGTDPFRMLPTSARRSGSVRVSDDELDALPPRLAGLIRALFVPTDGKMYIPTWGTNIVSLAAYVNHSETPNLRTADGFSFRTRRRISEGEELTADYRSYGATGCLPDNSPRG